MPAMSKEELFMSVATDLVKFYALLGHALKFVTDSSAHEQPMTLEQVEAQFHGVRDSILARLERNPVMKKKVETDYYSLIRLLDQYRKSGPGKPQPKKLKQEAVDLQTYAKDRTGSFSDLVAIFRSL
jgi:hypothetical protein